jgi:hypothetical protein
MELSVIISSSNQDLNCLHRTLTGYANQQFKDFELIVAGLVPDQAVKDLLKAFSPFFPAIKILQPEQNRAALLNKAIQVSESEYLVFTKSNCIPRKDFLEIHQERKEETFFLSGGHFRLAPSIYERVETEHITRQTCFELKWLKKQGLKFSLKNQQLSKSKIKSNIINALLPGKATWNPHNVSCWKKDLLEINGFDEQINSEAAQAKDLCQRLQKNDIKGIKVHFNAICLHLNQQQVLQPGDLNIQPATLKAVHGGKPAWTNYGIYKGQAVRIPYTEIDPG